MSSLHSHRTLGKDLNNGISQECTVSAFLSIEKIPQIYISVMTFRVFGPPQSSKWYRTISLRKILLFWCVRKWDIGKGLLAFWHYLAEVPWHPRCLRASPICTSNCWWGLHQHELPTLPPLCSVFCCSFPRRWEVSRSVSEILKNLLAIHWDFRSFSYPVGTLESQHCMYASFSPNIFRWSLLTCAWLLAESGHCQLNRNFLIVPQGWWSFDTWSRLCPFIGWRVEWFQGSLSSVLRA